MVEKFIREHIDNCICFNEKDDFPKIGMPHPYSVPTETEEFRDMFYWDTYFTNVGLLIMGRSEQARFNIENIAYLVNRFGFMPNTSNFHALRCSQPPVLSLMIRDYYDFTGDKDWLKSVYTSLIREHDFWNKERITDWGLNHYGGDFSKISNEGFYKYYTGRVGCAPFGEDMQTVAQNALSEGESGWDYSPRFGGRAFECAAVDLNSLLYALERNVAFFKRELCLDDFAEWDKIADERLKLIRKYLWNEEKQVFLDRNQTTGEFSPVVSAASYFALLCGVANNDEAEKMAKSLTVLDYDFGISACEKHGIKGEFQWDFPNAWPPLQYVAIKGLLNYNMNAKALKIANGFLSAVEETFAKTQNLWEKYNVCDGTDNAKNEYKMPPMLGWSAGTYLFCKKLIDERKCVL